LASLIYGQPQNVKNSSMKKGDERKDLTGVETKMTRLNTLKFGLIETDI
jgi:hypothetical protein